MLWLFFAIGHDPTPFFDHGHHGPSPFGFCKRILKGLTGLGFFLKKTYLCAMLCKKNAVALILGLLIIATLSQHCANVVSPVGGPKDIQPPMIVETRPENRSVNFDGQRIDLVFDEYLVLDNANQNVLISPPLAVKPTIKLNNKTVSVRFNEKLAPNTTYTIHFGNAIKDLHEGNVFKDYVYSFAIGAILDTFSLAGKVISAQEKKPVEDVFVTLYDADRSGFDTLPLTTLPNHITKTDKEGRFRFQGLADKDYFVFAVKDANANYYFDLPNEEAAFLDTLVHAVCPKSAPPIVQSDTTASSADSTLTVPSDTLIPTLGDTKALDLTLYLFSEIDSTQMLLEKKLVDEGQLRFVFRHPAHNVRIATPEILPDSLNLVKVASPQHDTISWYFTPKVKDSLWVSIQYDTLINDSTQYNLVWKDKRNQTGTKPLTVKNNLNGNCLMPEKDLIFTFTEPVLRYLKQDSASFAVDTLVSYGDLNFVKDDEYGFRYRLQKQLEEGVDYSISLPDSAFFSVRGRTNNAFNVRFHCASDNEFGNLFVTVVPPENLKKVVVLLLNDRGNQLDKQVITEKTKMEFWYLPPGKYKLQAILDADGNEKWSTGNYRAGFLPETIVDFGKDLEIRGGWDIDLDEEWKIGK